MHIPSKFFKSDILHDSFCEAKCSLGGQEHFISFLFSFCDRFAYFLYFLLIIIFTCSEKYILRKSKNGSLLTRYKIVRVGEEWPWVGIYDGLKFRPLRNFFLNSAAFLLMMAKLPVFNASGGNFTCLCYKLNIIFCHETIEYIRLLPLFCKFLTVISHFE